MITILCILLVVGLLWVGFKVTGAVLLGAFWLLVKLPLALIMFILGTLLCCTLILIPVGICLFKVGASLIIPGSAL